MVQGRQMIPARERHNDGMLSSIKGRLFLALALAVLCVVAGPQASAQAKDAGVAGKWHFVLDTPGGDRENDADFTVDADGKVGGTFGQTSAAGTYKDGKLNLDFQMTSEEAGETAAMKLAGKVDDSKEMTGTWEFSSYSGTFKATRPKE